MESDPFPVSPQQELPGALIQGSVSWAKSARVVNALPLGQWLTAVSLLDALALLWGRLLLDPDAVPISQIRV